MQGELATTRPLPLPELCVASIGTAVFSEKPREKKMCLPRRPRCLPRPPCPLPQSSTPRVLGRAGRKPASLTRLKFDDNRYLAGAFSFVP